MRLRVIVILSLLFVFGCTSDKKNEAIRTGVYFDLVELLNDQVEKFGREKPTLTKELSVNGEKETRTVKFDSTSQWSEELQLFYQADINKLGLEEAYITQEVSEGAGRNKVTDTAKTNKPVVRSIEYNYLNDNLESIRIIMRDENPVYKFEKELFLYFESNRKSPILKSFFINGDQNMLLKAPLNYSLKATIGNSL